MLKSLKFLGFLLLILFLIVSAAPNVGMYYSGPGNSSGICPIKTCPNCTNPWQYNSGCSFNISMICTNCTNALPSWSYYSATGGLINACAYSSCTRCSAGQQNLGCNSTSPGACAPCTNLILGNYWVSGNGYTCNQTAWTSCNAGFYLTGNTNFSQGVCSSCGSLQYGNYWITPGSCTQMAQTICSPGYYGISYTNTTAGQCVQCPANTISPGQYYVRNSNINSYCATAQCGVDCKVGQYAQGCNATFNGTCAPCLNALPQGMSYNSTGGSSGQCPISGCLLACSTGYYVSGCGTNTLSCAPCNNSIANVNYYSSSNAMVYNYSACPVTSCMFGSCYNGWYLSNCGGMSNGTCVMCGNTQ